MHKIIQYGLGAVIFFLFSVSVIFADSNPNVQTKPDSEWITHLQQCTSQEVGISFRCDPAWKLDRRDKTLLVTINENPKIEMIIEESDQAVHFMSELNEAAFENMGRYEKGFYFEHLTYCNRETIKINGYLKNHPEVRVSDFYLIDHLRLHSVKFSVAPREAWEDYKWLIKEIVDSMRFIKQVSDAYIFSDKTNETCEDLIDPKTDSLRLFRIDQI